ncbi:MAG: hypothetical protein P8Y24_04255 [Gammaproteobacteria bacterium]
MSSENQQKKKITFKQEFLMMALVFLAPIIISWWLYTNLDKWQQGGRNNGNLVEPARLLQDVTMHGKTGSKFKFSDLRGKWLLVQIEKADCNETCASNLLKTRQGRLSQGGNIGRVQRVLIVTGGLQSKHLSEILHEHREMIVVSADEKAIEQFKLNQNDSLDSLHRVYMVDPNGYYMMSYEKEFPAIHLIKDLQHLLKYSRIG